MIYPETDNLNQHPRYVLALLAAKRAQMLKGGAPPLVETNSDNLLTIALEEIAAGKIRPRILSPTEVEVEIAVPTTLAELEKEEEFKPEEAPEEESVGEEEGAATEPSLAAAEMAEEPPPLDEKEATAGLPPKVPVPEVAPEKEAVGEEGVPTETSHAAAEMVEEIPPREEAGISVTADQHA